MWFLPTVLPTVGGFWSLYELSNFAIGSNVLVLELSLVFQLIRFISITKKPNIRVNVKVWVSTRKADFSVDE